MTFLPVFQEIQIDSADVLTATTATTRQDAGGLLADVGLANEASRWSAELCPDMAMAASARSRDTWLDPPGWIEPPNYGDFGRENIWKNSVILPRDTTLFSDKPILESTLGLAAAGNLEQVEVYSQIKIVKAWFAMMFLMHFVEAFVIRSNAFVPCFRFWPLHAQ